MSGRKFSEVQLQQQRQEKLDILQTLDSLRTETTALCQQLDTMTKSQSAGLRATFSQEINAAQQWLTEAHPAEGHNYNVDSTLTEIKNAHAHQASVTAAGREYLESLQLALTQKADAMGQALAKQLAAANQQLLEQRHVLQLWCGEAAITTWQQSLARANELLETEHYGTLQTQLTELQGELSEKGRWSSAQEEKHQRRLYLLKALRQVSAELGFEEQVGGPQFEKNGDRGSRILLSVDTHDQGRIDFHLTLDGLASFSEMGEDRCPVEFGTLSQQLEEEFGVHTRFRPVDGSAAPVLRQKGEKELSEDGGQVAEVS